MIKFIFVDFVVLIVWGITSLIRSGDVYRVSMLNISEKKWGSFYFFLLKVCVRQTENSNLLSFLFLEEINNVSNEKVMHSMYHREIPK